VHVGRCVQRQIRVRGHLLVLMNECDESINFKNYQEILQPTYVYMCNTGLVMLTAVDRYTWSTTLTTTKHNDDTEEHADVSRTDTHTYIELSLLCKTTFMMKLSKCIR
jgi:hypothetical protein